MSHNSSSSEGCRFCDPQAVEDLTCSTDRLVRLQFTNCNGMCLYAHPVFLSAWSGVLRSLLEDVQEVSTPRSSNNFNNSNSDQDRYITVPLDDSETAAWEDALALMHPSRQLLKISWDSAARLLLLARKYDMPAITGGHGQLGELNCSSTTHVATASGWGVSAVDMPLLAYSIAPFATRWQVRRSSWQGLDMHGGM